MKRSSSQELQSSPTSWEYINICLKEGRQINYTYLQWTLKHYEKTSTTKNTTSISWRPIRLTLLPQYVRQQGSLLRHWTQKQAVFSCATDQWWTNGESQPLLQFLPSACSISSLVQRLYVCRVPRGSHTSQLQWNQNLKEMGWSSAQLWKYKGAVSSLSHITLLSYQDHPDVHCYLWSLSRRYFSLSALLIFRSGCRCSWCVFTFWLST